LFFFLSIAALSNVPYAQSVFVAGSPTHAPQASLLIVTGFHATANAHRCVGNLNYL
jgi:hypothetical protein